LELDTKGIKFQKCKSHLLFLKLLRYVAPHFYCQTAVLCSTAALILLNYYVM